MNRAPRDLAEAGHIERRRKAGARVADPVRRATLRTPMIRSEVEASGARHRLDLLERAEPMPSEVAARLRTRPGGADAASAPPACR